MATCPHCHEYLGEGHVCRGRSGQVWWWIWTLTVALLVGGSVGSAAFAFAGRLLRVEGADLAGLLIGPIAAFLILRSLRQW